MRALLLFALAVVMAGCASVPRQAGPPLEPLELRRQLQQLDHFSFQGKLAAAAGEEGFNADLVWGQRGGGSTLELRAPLGFGSATVVSDGENFSYVSSRGDRLEGSAAAAELERRIGFAAPLSALRFWVLGVPDPSHLATETPDEQGRLATLEQDNWHVEYSEYRMISASARELFLPRRLTLTRDAIRLRLIVTRWQITLP